MRDYGFVRIHHALVWTPALTILLAACQTAGLRDSYMALDSQGARRRTVFFTDTQSIYCIGEVVSARNDLTVHGRIRSVTQYDPVSGGNVPYELVYADEEDAPGKTTLTLAAFTMLKGTPGLDATGGAPSQGLPYPVGDYVCEISLDGQLDSTVAFSVAFPDCPTVPVLATVPCRGWVKPGSVCPSVTPNVNCTCGATSGNWECGP